MKELEVKILEINKVEIINRIKQLWWIKTFEWEIFNEFLVNQDWKKLRLRQQWNEIFLTYKNKIQNDNSMENDEYEIKIDNLENCIKILENIWFTKYWESKKIRIEYRLWNIKFDLDKYEWIPRLIEIESDNKNDLNEWVQLLWYSQNDTCILTERPLKEKYWII